MESPAPILLWFRRDFRLSDHPALASAAQSGRPVIPVFLLDEVADRFGAAPKWRLGQAVEAFQARLGQIGSRLILRRGAAREVLLSLARETGAQDVWWSRAYDPDAIARDTAVKSALKTAGLGAKSWPSHVLFEPWTVTTRQGGFFKVYSPMWRAVKDLDVAAPDPAPQRLAAPERWPESDRLQDWALGHAMRRGASVLAQHACVGEAAAGRRLAAFLDGPVRDYKERRDFPAEPATSRLSENLAWGEIGPRTVWHAGLRAHLEGLRGAEHFLKELVWREFAYHLIYHSPHLTRDNWREGWDAFPWSEDADSRAFTRWCQGRTGEPFVDAAMREMYVTGRMHNRARMIVASYLTKHLMTHWKLGMAWFDDCLTDWDPASNAMGWQWVAGSGPDAAPYFRVFNPATQAEKFDPKGRYRRAWIAEGRDDPPETARDYFAAIPRAWGVSAGDAYSAPLIDLKEGRERALAAYSNRES